MIIRISKSCVVNNARTDSEIQIHNLEPFELNDKLAEQLVKILVSIEDQQKQPNKGRQ